MVQRLRTALVAASSSSTVTASAELTGEASGVLAATTRGAPRRLTNMVAPCVGPVPGANCSDGVRGDERRALSAVRTPLERRSGVRRSLMSRSARRTALCSMKWGGPLGALLRAIAVSTASVMVSTIAFMEGAVAFAISGYLAEVRRGLRRGLQHQWCDRACVRDNVLSEK